MMLRGAPSSRLRAMTVMLALAATIAACGLRTPVRPPERTAPVIPGEVTAIREDGETVVRWKRAEHSADGQDLHDLAEFVVERKRDGEETWQRVATIDVVDQEKIRRRRDFSWHDTDAAGTGTSYRVLAVCADGQEGPPTQPAVASETLVPAPAEAAPGTTNSADVDATK